MARRRERLHEPSTDQRLSGEIDRLRAVSGAPEGVVREAFKDLLKDWSKARGLYVRGASWNYATAFKSKIYPGRHGAARPAGAAGLLGGQGHRRRPRRGDRARVRARATRRTTSSSRTPPPRCCGRTGARSLRCGMTDVTALDRLVEPVLRLGAAGNRRVQQGGGAVQGRPAERAGGAAGEDRRGLSRQRGFQAAAEAFLTHARETINPRWARRTCGRC